MTGLLWQDGVEVRRQSTARPAGSGLALRSARTGTTGCDDTLQWRRATAQRHCLLRQTLGLGPEIWRALSKRHNIGKFGKCEGDMMVDDRILTDLVSARLAVAGRIDALGAIPK